MKASAGLPKPFAPWKDRVLNWQCRAGGAAADSEAHKQKKVGQLQRLRNFAAKRMRNLAEITAEHISKCAC